MEDVRLLHKKIKRQVHGQLQKAYIRFPIGLGEVCYEEVLSCLAQPLFPIREAPSVQLTKNAIEISSLSFRELLALGLQITTARDLLWLFEETKASSIGQLKTKIRQVPWDYIISPETLWSVKTNSQNSIVFHEGSIKEIVSKEIEKRKGKVVPTKEASQRLDVRLDSNRLQIGVSIPGRYLYQRRYKTSFRSLAPLKEDLAQGMIRFALAQAPKAINHCENMVHVWIPFAGSGTLAFEGAISLFRIAPEVFFGPLGAEQFPCTPGASVQFARKTLRARSLPVVPWRAKFYLVEKDPQQFAALSLNVTHFFQQIFPKKGPLNGIDIQTGEPNQVHLGGEKAEIIGNNSLHSLTLERGDNNQCILILDDAYNIPPPALKKGDILLTFLNPPYGGRLQKGESIPKFYEKLASIIAMGNSNNSVIGSILIPDENALHSFLKALHHFQTKTIHVRHGGKKIFLLAFWRLQSIDSVL